ncbi:MAG: hypothetical protein ACI87N_001264 [Flavobacteriales bacterium]|jgi:hypothetical protein
MLKPLICIYLLDYVTVDFRGTKNKIPLETDTKGKWNEKGFDQDQSGSDLDVPGSELDDSQEKLGSEHKENNYFSIGGDNHHDLDEDNG